MAVNNDARIVPQNYNSPPVENRSSEPIEGRGVQDPQVVRPGDRDHAAREGEDSGRREVRTPVPEDGRGSGRIGARTPGEGGGTPEATITRAGGRVIVDAGAGDDRIDVTRGREGGVRVRVNGEVHDF